VRTTSGSSQGNLPMATGLPIAKFRVRKASGFSQGYVSDFKLCLKYETSGVAESDRET